MFNEDLSLELGRELPKGVKFIKNDRFYVKKDVEGITVGYRDMRDVSRSALLIVSNESKGEFYIEEKLGAEDICFFTACCGNEVLNIETIKKLIRNIAMLGYNELMLHTSVTYEVDNEPAFGYLTGRYTKAEIREIDEYARQFGIELIPSVQTLAHVKEIDRYVEYSNCFDCDDILLVGDERVEELIENIFKTVSESFSSRRIHIGMDEAHKVGLGKYLNLHGYQSRFDILIKHLDMVCGVAKKYGFECIAWSDMFLNIARQSGSKDENGEYCIPKYVIERLPNNLELCHWEYSEKPYGRGEWDGVVTLSYDEKFKMHEVVVDRTWYAATSSKIANFLPYNQYSETIIDLGVDSARKHGITRMINTVWSDDGGECALFGLLPAIAYFPYRVKGISREDYLRDFKTLTGYSYEDFIKLEYPNSWGGRYTEDNANNTKIALYNDLFCGQFDTLLNADDKKYYEEAIEAMEGVPRGRYDYLFDVSKALCRVLSLKYDMGQRLRLAYKANDKAELCAIVVDMDKLIDELNAFTDVFERQWYVENKPYGLEVQEYRLGGLVRRLKHCRGRLNDYLNGNGKIEELDLELLKGSLWLAEFGNGRYRFNQFTYIASVNVF